MTQLCYNIAKNDSNLVKKSVEINLFIRKLRNYEPGLVDIIKLAEPVLIPEPSGWLNYGYSKELYLTWTEPVPIPTHDPSGRCNISKKRLMFESNINDWFAFNVIPATIGQFATSKN